MGFCAIVTLLLKNIQQPSERRCCFTAIYGGIARVAGVHWTYC